MASSSAGEGDALNLNERGLASSLDELCAAQQRVVTLLETMKESTNDRARVATWLDVARTALRVDEEISISVDGGGRKRERDEAPSAPHGGDSSSAASLCARWEVQCSSSSLAGASSASLSLDAASEPFCTALELLVSQTVM